MDTPGDDILPPTPPPEAAAPPPELPPPEGLEAEPAPPRFYRRPAFQRAAVVIGVILFLIVIGLLLPSPFWRF